MSQVIIGKKVHNISDAAIEMLIKKALDAREHAYAPYSHYQVGAAVMTKEAEIFTGCNVENASYGATNCAERTAVFKAVSEGENGIGADGVSSQEKSPLELIAVAIVGGPAEGPMDMAYPCGICRQVLREFCNPKDMTVIVARSLEEYEIYTLEDLLPFSFGPEHLR